ncbi:hypothetical protein Tco_0970321 [Tanacetum coccineum]
MQMVPYREASLQAPPSQITCLALRSQSRHHLRQIIFQAISTDDRLLLRKHPELRMPHPLSSFTCYIDGDDEDEPSEEDEDDDVDMEADGDEEEEEHLVPADSVVVALPATDQAPSAEETEPFETDEFRRIPSEDPYEEAARQLLEQAPRSPEYVPDLIELEDHVPVYIPELEHPKDLVPAEDEAPIEAYITEVAFAPPLQPSFLPLLIRTPRPTMARRVDCSSVDTEGTRVRDIERRMMAALEVVNLRVSYQVDVRSRESSEFYSRHHDTQKDRAAVRAEIEVLRRERLAYEQENMENRQDLARYEAYSRALEARITVLETQALEARARDDTLEDAGSSAKDYFSTIL